MQKKREIATNSCYFQFAMFILDFVINEIFHIPMRQQCLVGRNFVEMLYELFNYLILLLYLHMTINSWIWSWRRSGVGRQVNCASWSTVVVIVIVRHVHVAVWVADVATSSVILGKIIIKIWSVTWLLLIKLLH